MYERMFYGLRIGCDCANVREFGNRFDTGAECDRNQTRYGCRTAEAMNPVRMSRFDGSMLCGKVAGTPFVRAIRPNSAGSCPGSTLPCLSIDADPEVQTCYDPDVDEDD